MVRAFRAGREVTFSSGEIVVDRDRPGKGVLGHEVSQRDAAEADGGCDPRAYPRAFKLRFVWSCSNQSSRGCERFGTVRSGLD